MWQSRVEIKHCELLRKTHLEVKGEFLRFFATFAFEPRGLSSVLLLLPDPLRSQATCSLNPETKLKNMLKAMVGLKCTVGYLLG